MQSPLAILTVAVFAIAFVVGAILTASSCTSIEPGHVGVSVRKCSGGGVNDKPIPTGYYWASPFCEEVIAYPTSLQTVVLTQSPTEGKSTNDESITVTSSEGLPISIDISLSFTLDPATVPALYTKYRQDIDHIGHTFMRQTIREGLQMVFAKYTAEQLYSDKKEIARAEAQAFLTEHLSKEGVIIQQFTLNEIRVPKQVTEAINGKVAMIQEAQKAEQEVRKTRALAEQKKAEAEGTASATVTQAKAAADSVSIRAKAEAEANEVVSRSLTGPLIQYEYAKKWNGTLPTFTGGGIPLVNLPGVR